jgi:predicted dehydrogenase
LPRISTFKVVVLIRLGIVGTNYGRNVIAPAFRNDPRCLVLALAGTDQARTAEIARASGIPAAFGNWEDLLKRADIDAVAIATPPAVQPMIAIRAFERDKAVLIEKPMAASLADAADMLRAARIGEHIAMIDFNFAELPTWRKARDMLHAGAIGQLRHFFITWNFENRATELRLRHWKTSAADGGGTLGNIASHAMYYIEWFCGPINELTARLSCLPDDPELEVNVMMSFSFPSGASGSLTISSASFLGSGHRLEFYGEDGTLVLANPTTDYMRGFTIHHASRPAAALKAVPVDPDPLDANAPDGRIAPVSRLASRFLDAIERRQPATPSLTEGYRVQLLLDAARRSHEQKAAVKIADPDDAQQP